MPQPSFPEFDPSGPGLKNDHFIGLPFTEENAQIILLPVPWDVTTSYQAGTSKGPENILTASTQLDLYEEGIKDAWQLGIFMDKPNEKWVEINGIYRVKAKQLINFLENGGKLDERTDMQQLLKEVNSACLDLKQWVYEQSKHFLSQGKGIGIIGGEHSVPLGFLDALSEQYSHFGILQIDAHMDLRKVYEGFTYSHASIFYNALQLPHVKKLVQVGVRDFCQEEIDFIREAENRILYFSDEYLQSELFRGNTWQQLCQQIIHVLPKHVYVSFDIDGLQQNLCPHTGTPVPGGLTFTQATFLIQSLVQSGRTLIGFDVCEVAGPPHEWDGNVGARIIYKLSNWLGRSQGWI